MGGNIGIGGHTMTRKHLANIEFNEEDYPSPEADRFLDELPENFEAESLEPNQRNTWAVYVKGGS